MFGNKGELELIELGVDVEERRNTHFSRVQCTLSLRIADWDFLSWLRPPSSPFSLRHNYPFRGFPPKEIENVYCIGCESLRYDVNIAAYVTTTTLCENFYELFCMKGAVDTGLQTVELVSH